MVNDHQDNGLAISTPDPRAVTGKNACAASQEVKLVPDPFFTVADQAQESAPSYSNNLCISCEGLPCAIPPGAQLTGGGISNRPQSFSFQSGHALSHKLAAFTAQKEEEARHARAAFENLRKFNQGRALDDCDRTLWDRIED
ncbi:MAG: hypothetical protein ACK5X3_11845 [Pseudomonadota bacterium]